MIFQVKVASLESSVQEWQQAARSHGVENARALSNALDSALNSQLSATAENSQAQSQLSEVTEVMWNSERVSEWGDVKYVCNNGHSKAIMVGTGRMPHGLATSSRVKCMLSSYQTEFWRCLLLNIDLLQPPIFIQISLAVTAELTTNIEVFKYILTLMLESDIPSRGSLILILIFIILFLRDPRTNHQINSSF